MPATIVQLTQPKSRQLTPYEQTQLARACMSVTDMSSLGSMPIEYVTGRAEFAGHVFAVSPDVLIPRVETEELVELILMQTMTSNWLGNMAATGDLSHLHIREVGTGSGALGISLFLAMVAEYKKIGTAPSITCELSDISPRALPIVQLNVKKLLSLELQKYITFLESDLLNDKATQKYDLIVANLPYIPTKRIETLDPSVKDHEPLLALDGGKDGFELIAKLLHQALERLKPHGEIWLEVDHTLTVEFMNTHYPQLEEFYSWQAFNDSFGQQRFLRGVLSTTPTYSNARLSESRQI